jgi:hypothetical protein
VEANGDMASGLKHILNPTTEIPFSPPPCCHSQANPTSSNEWENIFAISADPDVRQTCVPTPLRPMPEIQKPCPDRYDQQPNHVLSSGPQMALSIPQSLQAPPRQYYQAFKEDHTHTNLEGPDAVSITRFAPQSIRSHLYTFPLASHLGAMLLPQITRSPRHNSGIA